MPVIIQFIFIFIIFSLSPLCGYHLSTRRRRRIPKTNSSKTNCPPRRRIPKTNSTKTNSPPKTNYPEDELRRWIPRRQIAPRRRIPPRRRIAQTNSPKTNCHPKSNCADEFPKTNSPPKTNCEDEFPEDELPPEDEFRRRIAPRRRIGKTNSLKTNCPRKRRIIAPLGGSGAVIST